jgi:16S rRNA (guanine527-N7)-methyltransferase
MYNDDRLKEGLEALSIPYTEEMLTKLHQYYEMMIVKNQVMNLTAITEYDDVVVKHWLDSLCFAKVYLKQRKEGSSPKLIDIGTGAGFPGIPIKIFFSEIEVLLLDSLRKRIDFLQYVVNSLELKSISCVHGRAEELGRRPEYREQYDYAVSRAVARLSSLAEVSLPFVKQGGMFLPYKSESSDEEIEEASLAIRELGGKQTEVLSYEIPTSDLPRKLVVIDKCKSTPPKYPRGGGKPFKAPLVSKGK